MKLLHTLAILSLTLITASANIHDDIRQLSREKFKLTLQTGKIFSKHQLHENAEYEKLQSASLAASREYNQTRRAHPTLKPLYAKSDATQKKMIQARMNKDREASSAATREFTQIRMEIEKTAASIPELKAAQQKAIDANTAAEAKKLELLQTVPEGKAHAEKIEALDAKITELRKQMKLTKP
ncbi:hypothetical protein JO972_07880 [Verrucomicrobiaceae bacterium 5K15]|uniref:Uncharacterized protein n=1 Tax=Oceaniferula flava TaxID=2800421 RepID=A0AAE2SE60_9BACT|nr:hypothetical protein [Oceaniferula flavus]MBK1854875.1 hypothetical protein [Oceaniferula flavus]MBM1136181.1 hypothetical protein [Oceaniferula flavus]